MKPRVVILAPGASGSRETPVLVDLAKNLSSKGVMVVRFDFPYRLSGKKAPDSTKVLLETWRDALDFAVKKCASELKKRDIKFKQINVAVGGRSLGGRIASLLASDVGIKSFEITGPKSTAIKAKIDSCLFFSYPLHAPGKIQLKDEHFYEIYQRCLFVSGGRDPFASERELRKSAKKLQGSSVVEILDNGNHELKTRKTDEFTYEELNAQLVKIATLFV